MLLSRRLILNWTCRRRPVYAHNFFSLKEKMHHNRAPQTRPQPQSSLRLICREIGEAACLSLFPPLQKCALADAESTLRLHSGKFIPCSFRPGVQTPQLAHSGEACIFALGVSLTLPPHISGSLLTPSLNSLIQRQSAL